MTTNLISSNLELHSLSTGRKPRVATVMTMLKQHLFRYQGHIGAYLVVAGVDPTGSHLYTVHAHGSVDKLPFVTMGSGSLAAMSVFESRWKANMTRQEAMDMCADAIESGIWNDLGSGSNVDVVVIDEKEAQLIRPHRVLNARVPKQIDYKFARGTTAVLNERIIKKEDISKYVTVHDVPGDDGAVGERMDIDPVAVA